MGFQATFLAVYAVISVLVSGTIFAGIEDIDPEDDFSRPEHAPEPTWQEEETAIPPYPLADDLIEVKLSLPEFPYSLFIDKNSHVNLH